MLGNYWLLVQITKNIVWIPVELFKINLRQQVGLGQSIFKIYFASISMFWEEMSFMPTEFTETDLKLNVSAEYRLLWQDSCQG